MERGTRNDNDDENEDENCHPEGTVPSSRGTPTRSISVGCDDGAFRVPKESLAEGVSLNSKHYTLNEERLTWNGAAELRLTSDKGAINRAEHFNRSAASLTGTEGAYSKL